MKLVQSTWFNSYDVVKGNWPKEKFALFSIALSHHLLKKQGMPTRLNTNSVGFDILVNRLGLAYDEVEVCFEENQFDRDSKQLHDRYWSLNKLYAYSLQNEPFIHFDNDVYFFRKLDNSWRSASLVAQNEEVGLPYYTQTITDIHEHFDYIPSYLNMDPSSALAVNTGVSGGSMFEFFKDLYREVMNFINSNHANLDSLNDGFTNIFIEQCVMKKYAESIGIPFKYVLPNRVDFSKEYKVNKFHLLPHKSDYIHVMNYKSNPTICESIARVLYFVDKKLYHHCIEVADKIGVSGATGYKHSSPDSSLQLKYFFQRTAVMYRSVLGLVLPFDSLSALVESINKIKSNLTDHDFEVIEDVFSFEFKRYQFFNNLKFDFKAKVYRSFVDNQTIRMDMELEDCKIYRTEYVKMIETRWNWVESNEFFEFNAMHYLENGKHSPSYFAALIWYYTEQNSLKEYLLNMIEVIVIKLATEPVLVRELISKVVCILNGNKLDVERSTLLNMILFFLFHGVFSISTE